MLPRIEKLRLAVINVSSHLLVGVFVPFITVTLMEKWKYMNLIRPVMVNEVERLTGVFLWSPRPSVVRSVNTKPGSNYQMDTGYFIILCILHEDLNWSNNTLCCCSPGVQLYRLKTRLNIIWILLQCFNIISEPSRGCSTIRASSCNGNIFGEIPLRDNTGH